jgi:hypothetical protein
MLKVISIHISEMAHDLFSNAASSALPALAFTLVIAGSLAPSLVR